MSRGSQVKQEGSAGKQREVLSLSWRELQKQGEGELHRPSIILLQRILSFSVKKHCNLLKGTSLSLCAYGSFFPHFSCKGGILFENVLYNIYKVTLSWDFLTGNNLSYSNNPLQYWSKLLLHAMVTKGSARNHETNATLLESLLKKTFLRLKVHAIFTF